MSSLSINGLAFISAYHALEKFLRHLRARFGCAENTIIMVRSREKKLEDWGFMEYMQWLKELDKNPSQIQKKKISTDIITRETWSSIREYLPQKNQTSNK